MKPFYRKIIIIINLAVNIPRNMKVIVRTLTINTQDLATIFLQKEEMERSNVL